MKDAEAFLDFETYFPDYIINLDWDIKSPVFPQNKRTCGDSSHQPPQKPSVHSTSDSKVFKQISLFNTPIINQTSPMESMSTTNISENIKNILQEETVNVINQEIKNTIVEEVGNFIKEEVNTQITNEQHNHTKTLQQTIQQTIDQANSITNEQIEILEQNIKIFHPEKVVYHTELTEVVNNIIEKTEKAREDIKGELKKNQDMIEKFLNS